VFNQIRLLSFTSPLWENILRIAGGIMCSTSEDKISNYRSWFLSLVSSSRSKHGKGLVAPVIPDYIVVDSATYVEGKLTPMQSDFIELCMSLLNSQENRGFSIPKVRSSLTLTQSHTLSL
jgi:hypothetical protein